MTMARRIGEASVVRVDEMRGPSFKATTLFPDFRQEVFDEHAHWLVPNYFDPGKGTVVMSLHSWVIRTPRHTILVDTCVGNDKDRLPAERWHRQNNPYLERLRAAGIRPEEVDVVLCTHLHPDHVGWNTKLEDGRWAPTFPNARYLFSRTEYEHFQGLARNTEDSNMDRLCFNDSVLPVVEAGPCHTEAGIGRQCRDLHGRHPAPSDPGLSAGLEQPVLRPARGGAGHAAPGPRLLRRAPCAADARPFRRSARRPRGVRG